MNMPHFKHVWDEADYLEKRVRSLEAERDALKADAERYRWLRVQPNNTEAARIDVTQWSEGEFCNDGEVLRMQELDAAIDAAIAAEKGEK